MRCAQSCLCICIASRLNRNHIKYYFLYCLPKHRSHSHHRTRSTHHSHHRHTAPTHSPPATASPQHTSIQQTHHVPLQHTAIQHAQQQPRLVSLPSGYLDSIGGG